MAVINKDYATFRGLKGYGFHQQGTLSSHLHLLQALQARLGRKYWQVDNHENQP